MDETSVRTLLRALEAGEVTVDEVVDALRRLPFADLGFARVDHHRALRQGRAEAVYGPGKSPEQCAAIVRELVADGDGPVVLTRGSSDQASAAAAANPGAHVRGTTVVWRPAAPRAERVVVATAGT